MDAPEDDKQGSDNESEEIVVVEEQEQVDEDGKVYPKEQHPNAGKEKHPPTGLLPGTDDSGSEDEHDERNVKYFVPKFSPETLDEFLLDLMLCLRTSVLAGTKMVESEEREGKTGKSVAANSTVQVFTYDLNRAGTDHRVHVMDYAPDLFHRIRQAVGVSPSSFLLSWSSNDIKAAQVDGSDLVYSCDKRFVAKPLSDKECSNVMEILPRYYTYIAENPYSFLLKMVGLVRVSRGKRLLPYLIVENFFHPHIPLHYMYHISASNSALERSTGVLSRMSNTLRRRSSSLSKATLSRNRGTFRSRSSSLVFDPPAFGKDKFGPPKTTIYGNEATWKSTGRTILVDRKLKGLLVAQMDKDMSFLRDVGITDYQIVVGVHEGEPVAPPSPDLDTKRLVKVPSLVVFQSNTPPAVAVVSKKKPTAGASPAAGAGANVSAGSSPANGSHGAAALSPPLSPTTTMDFSNLRRTKRVSVQSVDSEPSVTSPFRSLKGGIHSKGEKREELYYLGITDIFGVNAKDKKRSEKAVARYGAFKEWLDASLEQFEAAEQEPTPIKSTTRPTRTPSSPAKTFADSLSPSLSTPAIKSSLSTGSLSTPNSPKIPAKPSPEAVAKAVDGKVFSLKPKDNSDEE